MAPGSAALALKAAALVSVFALLVVPSFGRCGHPPPPPSPPPPAPLPPTPAPAPGPVPTISCDDCRSQCYTPCKASIASECSCARDTGNNCENNCRAVAKERCKEYYSDCYKAGTCDCNTEAPDTGCLHGCSTMPCDTCTGARDRQCREDCSKQCSAPNSNCIPWTPNS